MRSGPLSIRPFPSPAALTLAGLIGLAALALSVAPAAAQTGPDVPAPSPKARAEQRVGVTDFAIDYSSPAVKGRTIWGGLVPFDQIWRTGANAPTKLTSSRDFTFGGKAVPAGSWSLYTIPGKTAWTVILNKNLTGGTGEYDEKDDVVRITVTPEALSTPRERMTFLFSDTADDGVKLDLEWEKLRLRVPVQVDTKAHVLASIDKTLDGAWRPHFASARWLLESNGDLDKALAYSNSSIAIKPTWWNTWVKAQVLGKKGNKTEAIAAAQQAQSLGKDDEVYGIFSKDIAKAIEGWKK